ncbi:MAG: tyrosine-protein phosphatase [Prevotellaceae bacterium]|nr:tyrosine-protein phosphatase [Prevotellaceae bacterium]
MEKHHYTYSEQSIHLDNVPNARDIGGYRMADGRTIKHGLLLRGGYLKDASENDVRRLSEEYKLAYIFDFRTEGEVRHVPDCFIPGAQNVWMPTIDPETEKFSDMHLPPEAYRTLNTFLYKNSSDPLVQTVASEMYPNLVHNEYTQLQYAAFLQTILKLPKANVKGRGVFWHCSQGKDRTGLGSAFLLMALGADFDMVLEDFALSNEFYQAEVDALNEKIAARGGTQTDFDTVQAFVGVSEKNFIRAFDEIRERYGSLENYVDDILLFSDTDKALLRDYYLE